MYSSPVQTFLTQKIAAILSRSINSEISIGRVDYIPFKNIILNDVFVEDNRQDTLLFVDELYLNLKELSIKERKVIIEEAGIKSTVIKLRMDTAGVPNFQHIVDYFSGDSTVTPDTTSELWDISCLSFGFHDSRFSFIDEGEPILDGYGISFSNLIIDSLNFDISDILLKDSVSFMLDGLCLKDQSGINIKNLNGLLTIKEDEIRLEPLELILNRSHVNADVLKFKYKSFDDFSDFLNKVKLEIDLKESVLSSEDLAYFVPDLKGYNIDVRLQGKIKGKISRLKTRGLKIYYAENTVISGDFSIEGLPEIDNAFIYLDFDELSTTGNDLETIRFPEDSVSIISLPQFTDNLGVVSFKGNLTGFVNDFVSYGTFHSNLGTFVTDIAVKQDTSAKKTDFSGEISLRNLQAGNLLKDTLFGLLSMNSKIKGFARNTGAFELNLDGNIENAGINGYNYTNVDFKGLLTDKKFDGEVLSKDPNLEMDFLGRIDFSEQKPVFDFTTDLRYADLYKLKIVPQDTSAQLSFQLVSGMTGDSPDNMMGRLYLLNTNITLNQKTLTCNELMIAAEEKNEQYSLEINSDYANISVTGQYKISEILPSVQRLIYQIAPSLTGGDRVIVKDSIHTAQFRIDIHDMTEIADLFLPDLIVASGTRIKGNVNTGSEVLNVSVESDAIGYSNSIVEDLSFELNMKDRLFTGNLIGSRFGYSQESGLNNFAFNFEGYNDSLLVDLHWLNRDSLVYSGDIAALATLSNPRKLPIPQITCSIVPSEIILANEIWNIDKSEVVLDSTDLLVKNLSFSKGDQFVQFFGKVSEKQSDSLFVTFHKLDLSFVNSFFKSEDMELKGTLNGTASVSGLYGTPVFYSSVDIDTFFINKENIGNIVCVSNRESNSDLINLVFRIKKGKLEPLVIGGNYNPVKNNMDFGVSIDRFQLGVIQPYVNGALSNVKGWLSGNIEVTGKPTDPKISGVVKAQRVSFGVDYLKTSYNFTNDIYIDNDAIRFDKMKIFDQKGNIAVVDGRIIHNKFSDIRFDINVDAQNFMFLNTTEADNETYYGSALASGLITLSGSTKDMRIDINARTEKGTKFNIPLTTGTEVNQHDFISFVSKTYTDNIKEKEEEINLSGMQLNFELDVTPEAEVQIIFDSKVGDVIRGVGSANLKMQINTLGEFNMYGEYTIEKGDYLFTLENVVNKRFDIEKGGTIKWNGSPYDAYVDLNAIYRLKAPLYDLMLGLSLDSTDIEKYKKRTPVECHMKMTKTIMDPEMAFDIEIPLSDDNVEGVLSNLSSEEKNKQLLSLLILNRFYTPSAQRGANVASESSGSNAVGVTSSELLSNQLSHWLSQISNDFDIGVNYRPGDEITNDELEVALSTQLFNDRVAVNGNVGVGGQQNTSGLVGDFDVNVKMNKSGKLQLKAFTRSNEDMIYENSPYTQGIGIFYREDFNSVRELLLRLKRKKESSLDE